MSSVLVQVTKNLRLSIFLFLSNLSRVEFISWSKLGAFTAPLSPLNSASFKNNRLSLLEQLSGHFLEASGLWVELWRLNELQEEIGKAASQAL